MSNLGAEEVTPRIQLALLGYENLNPEASQNFGYVLYLIPDLIRESLQDQSEYQLSNYSAEGGSWEEREKNRLEKLVASGADFGVWGYLVAVPEGLKVVHQVFDASTGQPVYVQSQFLTPGPAIVGEVEESVKNFTQWVRKDLPPPSPREVVRETIVVEKVVEKIVERFVEIPRETWWFMETGLGLGGYADPWREWMEGYLNLKLEMGLPFGNWEGPYGGLILGLRGLKNQTRLFVLQNVSFDLIYIPVLLQGGWTWIPLSWLGLDIEAAGGGSWLFGRWQGQTLSYLRPSWGMGGHVHLFPQENLSFKIGVEYLGTWIMAQEVPYLGAWELVGQLQFKL